MSAECKVYFGRARLLPSPNGCEVRGAELTKCMKISANQWVDKWEDQRSGFEHARLHAYTLARNLTRNELNPP